MGPCGLGRTFLSLLCITVFKIRIVCFCSKLLSYSKFKLIIRTQFQCFTDLIVEVNKHVP